MSIKATIQDGTTKILDYIKKKTPVINSSVNVSCRSRNTKWNRRNMRRRHGKMAPVQPVVLEK